MKFTNKFSKKLPDSLGWDLEQVGPDWDVKPRQYCSEDQCFCFASGYSKLLQYMLPLALLITESSWMSIKVKQLLINVFLFLGWSLTWEKTKGRGNYFLPLVVNSLIPLMYVSSFKKLNKKKESFFHSIGLVWWWARKLNPVHLRVRQLTQVNKTINDYKRGSVLLTFHKSRRNISWDVFL